jgi:putative toxin-antitoxin system antitoxin component (TIGR02293 family)
MIGSAMTTTSSAARMPTVRTQLELEGFLTAARRNPSRKQAHAALRAAYELEPMVLIDFIKRGVSATVVDAIAQQMSLPKERLLNTLGLASATVNRKIRTHQPLSADESSRVLGMARLVGQVEAMVIESGNPEGFDAAAWLARWLERPLPALGGRKPAELMDTTEGQQLVSKILARVQSGAYS